MSMARRLAKCSSARFSCAGQNRPPVQRAIGPPAPRAPPAPHTGQAIGHGELVAVGHALVGHTRHHFGITSPARRTITKVAYAHVLAADLQMCSVALVTVTPPTNTGANLAGAQLAVRPTCTSMASMRVVSSLRRVFVRHGPARLWGDEGAELAPAAPARRPL